MTRFLGAALVFAASTMVGFKAYHGLIQRVELLSALGTVLDILRAEIVYRLTPIPDAIKVAASSAPVAAQGFTRVLVDEVRRRGSTTVAESWMSAAAQLQEPEREALAPLAHVLGRYGAEEQSTALSLAIDRLEKLRRAAEDEVTRSGKVYIMLGVCGGLGLAVVLI